MWETIDSTERGTVSYFIPFTKKPRHGLKRIDNDCIQNYMIMSGEGALKAQK